jgi:hypothetical protein
MKKFLKWTLMLPLIASMTIVGCTKDDDDNTTPPATKSPAEGKELIFSATSAEAELDIMVYADEALFVGYNKLYVLLYETGTKKLVSDAHVTFETEMAMMMGHSHSAPVESPTEDVPANSMFQGAVVFVMPSAGNGTWKLRVLVHNHVNNLEGSAESEVVVVSPTEARMYSFLSNTDNSMTFVSLVQPMDPQVGENTFELAIHKRESMMSWPPVDGLKVEIEPEMPTMGHGSPGNVNPVNTSNGHYVGKVNYTMTGLWRVHITIKDAGDSVMNDSNYLDMTF